jgi:hypothetical protein
MPQLFWLIAGACLFGLVASVVVHRAANVAPVWSIGIALAVVLALAAAAFAILMFARQRAFP